MSVIAISRGSFSGGKMLAERLAGELCYRCIDRDVVVNRASLHGVSQNELRNALREPLGFQERLKHKRYLYLALIQAALTEEFRSGKVVYHGHVGHLLLDRGLVFRVRVIAPLEYRVSMARQRLKLNRSEAIAYIHNVDRDRKKWAEYLYGVDWEDPSLYDAVINIEYLDIKEAGDMITAAARQQRWSEFDTRRQAAMNDLACASRVKANIATDAETANLEVEVAAEGGAIQVKGRVFGTDQIEEVEQIVRAVPGVTSVNLDQLVPRASD